MDEWHEVNDKNQPIPRGEPLLLYDGVKIILAAYDLEDAQFYGVYGKCLIKDGGAYEGITHWRRLPDPPEKPNRQQIPCPHCGRLLPVPWAGWWELHFFGEVECVYCQGKIGLEAKLVKRGD